MRDARNLAPHVGLALALVLAAGCNPSVTILGDDDDDVASPTPAPPAVSAGPDRSVIGGLRVLLDGSATTSADTWLWEQTAGPSTLVLSSAAMPVAYAMVPASAAPGDAWTFRLTATNANGSASDDAIVTAKAAAFEDFLAAITDVNQLGTSEGIDFDASGMWVISTQGFVSLFTTAGAYVTQHAVPGNPVGSNFRGDGMLLVANAGNQALETVNVANGDIATVTNAVTVGGAQLGAVNYPLPDANGNVYVTNRIGLTIFRYDAGVGTTKVFLSTTSNVNALGFGPEPDVLYAGLASSVLRVPILPNGDAGQPSVYADGFSEVDGIAFDAAGNLYVGCPNTSTLFVVPYVPGGPSIASRSFSNVGTNISRFVNVGFGTPAFGATTLYWTDLGQRSVGRIDVGLPPLDPPLAP